jgi:hypothetical protein
MTASTNQSLVKLSAKCQDSLGLLSYGNTYGICTIRFTSKRTQHCARRLVVLRFQKSAATVFLHSISCFQIRMQRTLSDVGTVF